MKFRYRAFITLLAILLAALLLAIAALPASSNDPCEGADDYDQCVANSQSSGNSSIEDFLGNVAQSWRDADDPNCDDDPDTPAPACSS